jgi:NADH/NAD ratio-sensing transcriptional regulator Rex
LPSIRDTEQGIPAHKTFPGSEAETVARVVALAAVGAAAVGRLPPVAAFVKAGITEVPKATSCCVVEVVVAAVVAGVGNFTATAIVVVVEERQLPYSLLKASKTYLHRYE